MTFIKPFYGCRAGEVYPVHFAVGDACPIELQDAAIELGVVEVVDAKKPAAKAKADKAADATTHN